MAAEVAHCGLQTGLHMRLYNPTTVFAVFLESKREEKICVKETERKEKLKMIMTYRDKKRQLMRGGRRDGEQEA